MPFEFSHHFSFFLESRSLFLDRINNSHHQTYQLQELTDYWHWGLKNCVIIQVTHLLHMPDVDDHNFGYGQEYILTPVSLHTYFWVRFQKRCIRHTSHLGTITNVSPSFLLCTCSMCLTVLRTRAKKTRGEEQGLRTRPIFPITLS